MISPDAFETLVRTECLTDDDDPRRTGHAFRDLLDPARFVVAGVFAFVVRSIAQYVSWAIAVPEGWSGIAVLAVVWASFVLIPAALVVAVVVLLSV